MKDLSNIIKEFEKIVKVPYVKMIPKHEPTSSYYHLVGCIAECMLRYYEYNQHVHGGYAEETALLIIRTKTNKKNHCERTFIG